MITSKESPQAFCVSGFPQLCQSGGRVGSVMKNMKHLLGLVVIVGLLAGCQSNKNKDTGATGNASQMGSGSGTNDSQSPNPATTPNSSTGQTQ
jgi:hypothetical protein